MQKRENIRLLIILTVLIAATVVVMTTGGPRRVSFNPELFSIQDTSQIDKIVVSGKSFINTLNKDNGFWKVNGKYQLDEGLRRTLLPVLKEIRIRRPAPESRRQEIADFLKDEGIKVEIFNGGALLKSFLSAGVKEEGITWLMETTSGQPYVVHLPGYESYLAGLFEITENDWRDRIVLTAQRQSFRRLTLEYPAGSAEGFSILFDGLDLEMPGVADPDTGKVHDYLNLTEYILADKYLNPGEYPVYDSIVAGNPFATITVEKTNGRQDSIVFFPKPESDPFIAGKLEGEQVALFEYNRIKEIFAERKDFEKAE